MTTEEYSVKFAQTGQGGKDGPKADTSVLDSRLKRLEDLAKQYPRRSDLPYQMAGVHFQKENLKESAKSLERAIYIDPHEAKYHYHLGRIYLKMRELERAEKAFRRSVELMPSERYTGGRAALGYLLCQKGDWAGARAEFEACARIEPSDPTPFFFLGCIDDARRDGPGAVTNLLEYLKKGGDIYRKKAIRILATYGVEAPEGPAALAELPGPAGSPPEKDPPEKDTERGFGGSGFEGLGAGADPLPDEVRPGSAPPRQGR